MCKQCGDDNKFNLQEIQDYNTFECQSCNYTFFFESNFN